MPTITWQQKLIMFQERLTPWHSIASAVNNDLTLQEIPSYLKPDTATKP